MTRYPTWAALTLVTALVAGCGPEKELPMDVARPDGSAAQQQAVPAKSDPEAKAVIDRSVKALTGGKPELRAKATASRFALKGQMFSLENQGQSLEATRSGAAVWPNRFYGLNETHPQGNRMAVETWLFRPDLAVSNNGQPTELTNVDVLERTFAIDLVGQNWMPLLLPATDPKAVVFDLQAITFEARGLHQLKLSLGDFPLYQLTFDAKSDALVRVEYSNSMGGVPIRKTMVYGDHKPTLAGLVLPYKIECRHNSSVVERWTVEKWEFPDKIGDEEFTPPKKK